MRDFQKWLIRGGTNPTGEVEVMVMVMNEIFATERKKVKATDAIITRLAETRMKALRENGVHNAPEMRRLFKKWRSLRPKTPSNKTEVPTEVPAEVVKPPKKP
jgi:hypothetical protein